MENHENENPKFLRIVLNGKQREELKPLLMKVRSGGSVVAQVFKDGFVAFLLSPEQTNSFVSAMKKTEPTYLYDPIAVSNSRDLLAHTESRRPSNRDNYHQGIDVPCEYSEPYKEIFAPV